MSKIVRSGDSYGVYRKEGNDIIFGESRFIYINNLGYHLTEIKIYADEMIDCWGLMDFEEFKKKLDSGWITLSIPNGATLDIHMLGSLKIDEANNYINPQECIKEIRDIVADLNDEPTSLELCRSAYEDYLQNKTIENKKKLRRAYYAMPEHMRHFVLGDMQSKDSHITAIIDQIDIEEIDTKFPFKKDEKFIELYKQVAQGDLPYYWAIIDIEGIKPFADANVSITEGFRKNFLQKYTEGKPISIHVYQENDFFVMSDDYMSFSLYKGLSVNSIPCLVLGKPKSRFVKDKMKVKYQPLTVEVKSD